MYTREGDEFLREMKKCTEPVDNKDEASVDNFAPFFIFNW